MQSMLKWLTEQLMEIEVTSLKTQVEKGAHDTERKTYRNGYRVRRWDTRMGTIYLTIPKVRSGGYQPFFLVNRQRSEAALMSVIQECWINGVSTRKMIQVFKSFGIKDISAGQVSNVTNGSTSSTITPGGSITLVASYTISQSAFDSGKIINVLTATASSVSGIVSDTSDNGIDNDNSHYNRHDNPPDRKHDHHNHHHDAFDD